MSHGILSKSVLITDGDGRENASQFRRYCVELMAALAPEGELEGELADVIVANFWRLRRVLRCKAGAIREQAGTASSSKEPTLHLSLLRSSISRETDNTLIGVAIRSSEELAISLMSLTSAIKALQSEELP